ncbi:hypothetical protein ALC62_03883 [Cyphomyrmex costatus]|uniref:Gustatory receptor n=1 Tax=Cyphomyrmex costatus TaxID=456900 RepID=A0A151IKR8_9HYME|nr:hypothetical protein ALC62_03883 [Cyphomyrmex costatus]
MTISLQSSMAPLFIISSFHCLGLFEYPLGQSRLHFSCLYALALWSSYLFYCYIPQTIQLWQLNSRIFVIILYLYILMAFSSIFISFNRYKELKACLRELSIIDDTLEAIGVPKDYRILRNWIIRIIIGWITFLFIDLAIMNSLSIILLSKISFQSLWMFFLPTNVGHIITLSALNCGIVLGYTSSRFRRVNEQLQVLCSDLFENNYKCRRQNRFILVRQRIARAKYHKQYVWILT